MIPHSAAKRPEHALGLKAWLGLHLGLDCVEGVSHGNAGGAVQHTNTQACRRPRKQSHDIHQGVGTPGLQETKENSHMMAVHIHTPRGGHSPIQKGGKFPNTHLWC